jgi:hypothetical protein
MASLVHNSWQRSRLFPIVLLIIVVGNSSTTCTCRFLEVVVETITIDEEHEGANVFTSNLEGRQDGGMTLFGQK